MVRETTGSSQWESKHLPLPGVFAGGEGVGGAWQG